MDIVDTLNEILKANYNMGTEQWKHEGGDLPETRAIEEILSLREYNDRLVRYSHALALALTKARDERNALSEAM